MKKFIWGAQILTPQIFLKTFRATPSSLMLTPKNILNTFNITSLYFYKILTPHAHHFFDLFALVLFNSHNLSNFLLLSKFTGSFSKSILKKFKFFKNILIKKTDSVLRKKFFYKFRKYEYIWENHIVRPERIIKDIDDFNNTPHHFLKKTFKFKFFNIWKTFHNKTFNKFFFKKKNIVKSFTKFSKTTPAQPTSFNITYLLIPFLLQFKLRDVNLNFFQTISTTKLHTHLNIILVNTHPIYPSYKVFQPNYNEFFPHEASFANFTKYYYAFHLTKTFSKSFHNYWSEDFYSELLTAYSELKVPEINSVKLPNLSNSFLCALIENKLNRQVLVKQNLDNRFQLSKSTQLNQILTKIPKSTNRYFFKKTKTFFLNFFNDTDILNHTTPQIIINGVKNFTYILDLFPKLPISVYRLLSRNIFKEQITTYTSNPLLKNNFAISLYQTDNQHLYNSLPYIPYKFFIKINELCTPFVTESIFFKKNISYKLVNLILNNLTYLFFHDPIQLKSSFSRNFNKFNLSSFFEPIKVKSIWLNVWPEFFKKKLSLRLNFNFIKRKERYDFKTYVLPSLRQTKYNQLSWNKFLSALVTSDEVNFYSNFFFNFNKDFFLMNHHLNSIHLNFDFEAFADLIDPYLDTQNVFTEPNLINNFSNIFQKNWYMSNYNPIYNLPTIFKKNLYRYENFSRAPSNPRYLQAFINGFISFWASMKSLFILQSNFNDTKDLFTNELIALSSENMNYFTHVHVKFFKKFPVSKFVELFTFSIFKKDLNYFLKFFKLFVEEMSLKEHKKVFYAFEFLLKKFLYKTMFLTQTYGIKFEISGKISVTGNSKTRNKIIKLGYYSLTHKKLKIDYLYDIIRTTTGVLGFRIFITY